MKVAVPTQIRSLTVAPGIAASGKLETRTQPSGTGPILAQMLALGVCGTDLEILGAITAGHLRVPSAS